MADEQNFEAPEPRAVIAEKVLCAVDDFIVEQAITCPEAIYQCERIIENAYEFIERICGIAGYVEENAE